MNISTIASIVAGGFCAALLATGAALGQGATGVNNTPHNLSASGGFGKHNVTFSGETRVCVFCHAPHNAQKSSPLWNHQMPSDATPYKMYGSSTFDSAVSTKSDRPTGSSRLCLSCHDGTIALNAYGGVNNSGAFVYMPSDPNPTLNSNLTTDLSTSHPISFVYSQDLANGGELKNPGNLGTVIKLDSSGMVQCTSCHDPHDNEYGNFLLIDNSASGSPLCTACHTNGGWSSAAHNPAQTATMTAACMNCHYAHSAPGPVRLMHAKKEVDNCVTTTCHSNGVSPATANVQQVLAQTYRHPVGTYSGVHDESETLPAQQTHVECADCHNPHQANRTGVPLSLPPAINGVLLGVKGINKDTLAVVTATNEYEVCFKCHSGPYASNFCSITETPPNRMAPQLDELKRFDRLQTTSFHPVTAQRLGSGASLLSNLQTSMLQIYCTDCHNSDQSTKAGGAGPNGPHGSMYEHILISRYDMPQIPPSSPSPVLDYVNRYALCFRCHSDSYIMGSSSGFVNSGVPEHSKHVQDRAIPCFACHDPHGVPLSGSSSAGDSRLINFAKFWAASATVPLPSYNPLTRTCVVTCHTTPDHSHSYTP